MSEVQDPRAIQNPPAAPHVQRPPSQPPQGPSAFDRATGGAPVEPGAPAARPAATGGTPAPSGDRSSVSNEARGGLFSGGVTGLLDGLRNAVGMRSPEVTDAERASINRMIETLPEMAGGDGRFNRGDTDAIVNSLKPELRGIVNCEINKRANQKVNQANPLVRPFVRAGANMHLRNHRGEYQQMGMRQAEGEVRGGLEPGFENMGDKTKTADPDKSRRISVNQLRQFGEDSKALEAIRKRAEEMGLPKIDFPNGIAVEDLQAIRDGRIPPNGRIARRP